MAQLVDIQYGTTIVAITCGVCSIPFGIPEEMNKARRLDGQNFTCPNGHVISYGRSAYQKLEDEKARVAQEAARNLARAQYAERRVDEEKRKHSATKGQLTKTKKRAANGVCPCCNRVFVNVMRHVASQHPDFVDETK